MQDKRAKYFVTHDGDGQRRVEEALAIVRVVDSRGDDAVVGSRFLESMTKPGRTNVRVLKLAIRFEFLISGVRLTDAHNGLRVMNRHAARFIHITQNRMAYASPIDFEIGRNRLSYREFPVHARYTEYSRAKDQSMWNLISILSDLFMKKG